MVYEMNGEQKEKADKAWTEYSAKLNNFVDWFTAIIISNFAYLVTLNDDKKGEVAWQVGFYASTITLTIITIIKVLGVRAADIRVEAIRRNVPFKDTPENKIENVRDLLSAFFILLGPLSLGASGAILKINLWTIFILTALIFIFVCCCCQMNMSDIKKMLRP